MPGAVRTKAAQSPSLAMATSRVMPEICCVSVVRSLARMSRRSASAVIVLLQVVGAPALVLGVELRPAAGDPAVDRPAHALVARDGSRRMMAVGALEVHDGVVDGAGEERETAGVAVRRAVATEQLAQIG